MLTFWQNFIFLLISEIFKTNRATVLLSHILTPEFPW